jgi:hypothetical protein
LSSITALLTTTAAATVLLAFDDTGRRQESLSTIRDFLGEVPKRKLFSKDAGLLLTGDGVSGVEGSRRNVFIGTRGERESTNGKHRS